MPDISCNRLLWRWDTGSSLFSYINLPGVHGTLATTAEQRQHCDDRNQRNLARCLSTGIRARKRASCDSSTPRPSALPVSLPFSISSGNLDLGATEVDAYA